MRAVALLVLICGCGAGASTPGGFRLAFALDDGLELGRVADFKAVVTRSGGFDKVTPLTVEGIEARTEDADGKAGRELVFDWPAQKFSREFGVRVDFGNAEAFTATLTATASDTSSARLAVGSASFDVPAGSKGEVSVPVPCLEEGCSAEPALCAADGTCDPTCAEGQDPDCPVRFSGLVVPGFTAAAGTVRGKDFALRGAVTYMDHGTTVQGTTHAMVGGLRR